jgi:predicted nucleic-acid-binding Zn-ribbon protein
MKDSLGLLIKGIKCDNCDYRDDDVSFDDYPQYLNKPCPECGENLLTQADLDATKKLIDAVKILNKLIPRAHDDELELHIPLQMNGSGSINVPVNSKQNSTEMWDRNKINKLTAEYHARKTNRPTDSDGRV